MRLISISYNLKSEYEISVWLEFLRGIKRSYNWFHLLDNIWFVKTEDTSEQGYNIWFVKTEDTSEQVYKKLYVPNLFNVFIVTEVTPNTVEGWCSNAFWGWLSEDDATRRNEDAGKDTSDEKA